MASIAREAGGGMKRHGGRHKGGSRARIAMATSRASQHRKGKRK